MNCCKVNITKEMREAVIQRHLRVGDTFNGAYHEGGKGRIWGYLGEAIVMEALGDKAIIVDNKDCDIIFVNRPENKDIELTAKVDVKTKTRKDEPKEFFDAMILDSSRHQQADVYIFTNIIAPQNLKDKSIEEILNYEYTTGYRVGLITKDDYYKKATFNKKGERSNNFLWKEDAWTLRYGDLKPFRPGIAI